MLQTQISYELFQPRNKEKFAAPDLRSGDYSLMRSISNIQERKCSREIFIIILNVSPNGKMFVKMISVLKIQCSPEYKTRDLGKLGSTCTSRI